MKLQDFDYKLPGELIAQYPAGKRSESRLLVVYREKGVIQHLNFPDFINFIGPKDILILNDTKVRRARVIGKRRSGGKVDILLLDRISRNKYRALLKPSNKIKLNEEISINNNGIVARLKERISGENIIEFDMDCDIEDKLSEIGLMPLPPYIKRIPEKKDEERYQTVYADKEGAIAAPTAGLHFTEEFLSQIRDKSTMVDYVTLHVGQGTFLPVKSEDVLAHKIHKEKFQIGKRVSDGIAKTKKQGGRVFAVGTTTTRVLETVGLQPFLNEETISGDTDLFIYSSFDFKVVDCLLTNFHLPRTTLFMLVCAFAGRELMMRAYEEAIKEKYRFFSYGDAMLII